MQANTIEAMVMLLERAGLKLPQQEIEKLLPVYKQNLERLAVLHAADLEEEVAGIFAPNTNG